ncbi:hypothetical protein AGMMS50268_23190 [Spirochaetia bacterium]|nr:hypothetical protein AGMMS50268_23190 [Spirochaetia bacterium]
MVTLEQVKLLESKVARAIDYVERVSGENALLQGKLDSYQKRIDELEVVVRQFKEEQGRIEDGILSALDRLNQFEDAIERSISPGTYAEAASRGSPPDGNKPAKTAAPKAPVENTKAAPRNPEPAPQGALEPEEPAPEAPVPEEPEEESVPGNPVLFSEDLEESLPEQADGAPEGDSPEEPPPEEVPSGELDIF